MVKYPFSSSEKAKSSSTSENKYELQATAILDTFVYIGLYSNLLYKDI